MEIRIEKCPDSKTRTARQDRAKSLAARVQDCEVQAKGGRRRDGRTSKSPRIRSSVR
jgi:hypothetical protein